jgi:hypothetical protein
MLTLLFSYGFSAVWKSLGLVSRGFCVVFVIAIIYCLFSAMKAMLRLRSLRRLNPVPDLASVQRALADIRDLMANVRQVIDATFYLFGFLLFSNLQQIANFADHTKASMDWRIFQNFVFHCFLAESAFFVFLFLHLSQWFVSGRVNACARRA